MCVVGGGGYSAVMLIQCVSVSVNVCVCGGGYSAVMLIQCVSVSVNVCVCVGGGIVQ